MQTVTLQTPVSEPFQVNVIRVSEQPAHIS